MAPDALDARRFAVVALADELVRDDAALLRAFGRAFDAGDDVSLVIHSRDDEPMAALAPAVEAAGLDGDDAPDLLVVPDVPGAEITIAGRAGALLSRRDAPPAFAALPRFDDTQVAHLRGLTAATAGSAPEGVVVGGELLEVTPDMAWAFAGGRWCEHATTTWFDRLLAGDPSPVVYDVGGNCGWFALRSAQAGAVVRAFEPVPGTAALLERNLRHHPDARVTRAAVADGAGRASMHIYSSCGNNSLAERTLPPGHPLRHEGMIEVDVVALDDLVGTDGFPAPTLVKIDVEGYELPVIRGARGVLARSMPAVILEWADCTSRDAGYVRDDIVTELRGLGYAPMGLLGDGTLVAPEDADDQVDTLVAAAGGASLPAG